MGLRPLDRMIHYMCLMLDELYGEMPFNEPITKDKVKMAELDEMIDKTQQLLDWAKGVREEKLNED